MTAYRLLVGLVAVGVMVMAVPLAMFLIVGWEVKRKDILDGLNAESRLQYFRMFCRNDKFDAARAHREMEAMYVRWYGRRHFVAPLALLLIVATAALYIAIDSVAPAAAGALVDVRAIGASGVAGAYMWVVNDFISRARKLDLSPSDLNWATLRFVIAVPLGFSIASIAAKDVGPFIAFAAGAFPLATLMDLLRRAAASRLGYEQSAPVSDDVVKLQGVNETVALRLANEDITTITQIAYCDPIRLTMRSNLTFNVVTDLMNQALAWEYFGAGMDAIRPLGLRGAVEIKHLQDALLKARGADHAAAAAALPAIAKALGQEVSTLAVVFSEVADDPFTIYLNSIWE